MGGIDVFSFISQISYQIHFCKRMFKNKYSIISSTKYSTIEFNRPIHL